MAVIRSRDYTFVTNNRADFTALYGRSRCMPGWWLLFPTFHRAASASYSAPPCHTLDNGILRMLCWKWIWWSLQLAVASTSIRIPNSSQAQRRRH